MGNAEKMVPQRQQANEIARMPPQLQENLAGARPTSTGVVQDLPKNASQVHETKEKLLQDIALFPSKYQPSVENGTTRINLYQLSSSKNGYPKDVSGTAFVKDKDGKAPVLEQMKNKVKDEASRMTPGETQVVTFYGVTPEQSASMIKALETGGAIGVEYDGKTILSFFVKTENYVQACNGAYDAKANGPNPTQGMTDILGAEIACVLKAGNLYEMENGKEVKEIRQLVIEGKIQLKSIPTSGDATEWSAGEYKKKENDWFVGYTSNAGNDFVIIQKQIDDKKQIYVVPKSYLDLTNTTDVGKDGLSFNNVQNERAEADSPRVVAQSNILSALKPCLGNVTHVLVNEGSAEVDPKLTALLNKMGQSVVDLSDWKPPVVGYYAILAGGEIPSNWCARLPFENTSVKMTENRESKSTETEHTLKIKLKIGGNAQGGAGSQNVQVGGSCWDPIYANVAGAGGAGMFNMDFKIWRDPNQVAKFVGYNLDENKNMILKLPEISSNTKMSGYVPWESSNFLESVDKTVKREVAARYTAIETAENRKSMADRSLENDIDRLHNSIAYFNVRQKPENKGKTSHEIETLVKKELSAIESKNPDEIKAIVDEIGKNKDPLLKSAAQRVGKNYDKFQSSLDKNNKALDDVQAAKKALKDDIVLNIALPGKMTGVQTVLISGLKLDNYEETGEVAYKADMRHGRSSASLTAASKKKTAVFEVDASNKPKITITKNKQDWAVAFNPEQFKNESGKMEFQIGNHEYHQAKEIMSSEQKESSLKKNFAAKKIPVSDSDLAAMASMAQGQTLKLSIGGKEYFADAAVNAFGKPVIKLSENTPLANKKGELAEYYITPKKENVPQAVTASNLENAIPAMAESGIPLGNSLFMPKESAKNEYGGAENVPVFAFYPGIKLQTGKERPEDRNTVSETDMRKYLGDAGCDQKEVDIALKNAKTGVSYALVGNDDKRYIVTKEDTRTTAVGYAVWNGVVHLGELENRSAP